MILKQKKSGSALLLGALSVLCVEAQSQVFFDKYSNVNVSSISGGANWQEGLQNGAFDYGNNGELASQRALLYSAESFQSNDGFRLTIEYQTGSISNLNSHNFSFGLISDDTDLASYQGNNPFAATQAVYSIGANLTSDNGTAARGLNFTNGTQVQTLDESGTRIQFATGKTTKVTIEVGIGGYWSYRINDEFEANGVLAEGFDLSKSYRVAVYGQDDQGGGKSIQSITLKKAYAAGERAVGLRGTWVGGVGDLESIKHFKTLTTMGASFSSGASASAQHNAPHKFLETIALKGVNGNGPAIDYVVAPSWGDLSLDEPESDPFLDNILAIKAAGFKIKAYLNSENFLGSNQDHLQEFVDRWKEYCDNDAVVQAFINSQPFHTSVWDTETQTYVDATETYPNRKYMFAYAEFVLKDYALRYAKYIDSWIFDDGGTMVENGDNATSGLVEEQRIYQAYANAVHAGNPEIPIAFNNGRSTTAYASTPFAHAVRFEDFTFGHAFGGNNNHAEKENGNQFNNNYRHVTRMTETNGYVHAGGNWEWDDRIVGNFHSKLSTTAWTYGPNQAWEEADFLQWNLEAMHAGGMMSWDGSRPRTSDTLYTWAYDLLKGLDDHLAKYQKPGAPNWARYATILPDAHIGQAYAHRLQNDMDFWDPEGDEVTLEIIYDADSPAWLTIEEDGSNPGSWILSGIPAETTATEFTFSLRVVASDGAKERNVTLKLTEAPSPYPFSGNTQIFALPNTDYGVDNVVTMQSAVITAPDGLATFQIAFDLTPGAGTNINSSATHWGIGKNKNFVGTADSKVDSITNLRIVNFSANGSDLNEGNLVNLSFENLDIANGGNQWDRIRVFTNGLVNSSNGNRTAGILDLRYAGEGDLTHLILDTGTNGAGSNLWQVNSIGVSYVIEKNDAVVGDVDGDGQLSQADMLLLRTAIGSKSGDAAYHAAADMDNDGTITRADYSIWYSLFRNQ
nr:GH107 fucanase [uncultured bacterium]